MRTATFKVLVGGAVVLALVLGAASISARPAPLPDVAAADASAAPIASSSTSPSLMTAVPAPATAWVPFTSHQYRLEGAYPDDWTVQPSQRAWTLAIDGRDPVSPAHDAFRSPDGDVRVSVWSMPFDEGTTVDTLDFERWIEAYCQKTGNTPCDGIHDRAVPVCIERRDCHFSLLVPFQDDVQAFLSGGIYPGDRMTVVAVWRGESHPSVAKYGGSRHLLEAFLSTMGVWPVSVPLQGRVQREVPVTPPA